ncbi:conserved hypothetical protein [uncultured Defluviicoccus sp.]|uniref:Uncharacterized protein n=1 Tax=metagenome TaxID=256318 RepID=A0A380TAB5_9ZZZZ|nr:conserved hypothetical protein [uncultured Defluviicoccus sp.]
MDGQLRGVGSWYQDLEKPSFNPPDWVFAPIWTRAVPSLGDPAYAKQVKSGLRGGKRNAAAASVVFTLHNL